MPYYPPAAAVSTLWDSTAWPFANLDRSAGLVNQAVLATGRIQVVGGLTLTGGRQITTLAASSATTPAGTPTNQWYVLCDSSLNVVAVTVDDTTTAWPANTIKPLLLATPYTPPVTARYYVGIVVVATTPPSLAGASSMAQFNGLVPTKGGPGASGFVGPGTIGATVAAPSTSASLPWVAAA